MSSPALQREAALTLLELAKLQGHLGALKATPAWERRAEVALVKDLRKLLSPPLSSLLARIERMGTVPSDGTARVWVRPLEALTARYAAIVETAALDAARHGRRRSIAELRSAGQPVRVKRAGKANEVIFTSAEFSERVLKLIRTSVFTASTSTMSHVTGDVMGAIAEAYASGLGIEEAAAQIRASFDGLLDWQLRRISRTEIVGYANLGTHETLRELGVRLHQWVTARDDRVRNSHVHLHGQVVRVGQRFGNSLRHPGDRSGPPAEWINCRCRAVPYIPPEGEPLPRTPFYAAV